MDELQQLEAFSKENDLTLKNLSNDIEELKKIRNIKKTAKEVMDDAKIKSINSQAFDQKIVIENQSYDNKQLIGQKHRQNIEDINLEVS